MSFFYFPDNVHVPLPVDFIFPVLSRMEGKTGHGRIRSAVRCGQKRIIYRFAMPTSLQACNFPENHTEAFVKKNF